MKVFIYKYIYKNIIYYTNIIIIYYICVSVYILKYNIIYKYNYRNIIYIYIYIHIYFIHIFHKYTYI